MTDSFSKTLGYIAILIISLLAVYQLGYVNGRFDLVHEPTRGEYEVMGWYWDETEKPVGEVDVPEMGGRAVHCWQHLDGNGSHCGQACRPNCYVTDWFRGLKVKLND